MTNASGARVRRRGRAKHGTDAGYYRHIRQAEPVDGWPRTPCDACRAAHSKANAERASGKRRTRPPRPPSRRKCLDCGTPVSERAQRCRRCARLHYVAETNDLPIRWRRVGLIWKAA